MRYANHPTADASVDFNDEEWEELKKRIKGQSSKGNDDNRLAVVFVGDGGSQNGRLPELLNACSKLNLPLLIVIIDNGREQSIVSDIYDYD